MPKTGKANLHQRDDTNGEDILAFQGIGRGLWGDTPGLVEATVQQIRDGWEGHAKIPPMHPPSTQTP